MIEGTPQRADEHAVDEPEQRPDGDGEPDRDDGRQSGVGLQQLGGQERG